MFIDICFPNTNEEAFIGIAKRLGTDGLCFVYDREERIRKTDDQGIKIYHAIKWPARSKKHISLASTNTIANGDIIYYYDCDKERSAFNTPVKSMTQVTMKEFQRTGRALCLPLSPLQRQLQASERYAFVSRLARKYKMPVFLSSFATSPYGLRSCKELESVAVTLKIMNIQRSNLEFFA